MKIAWLDMVHPVLWDRLTAAGMECIEATTVSREALLAGAGAAWDGVVLRSRLTCDAPLLDALPRLKCIARSGSGLENIDVAAASARGIRVFNSPEGNRDAVAEHAVGFLLMLLHKLRSADANVRAGRWDREAHRGRELGARTVAIIGFGHTGEAFARRLTSFGCRVLAVDPYREDLVPAASMLGVEPIALPGAIGAADVVSFHVPLTPETLRMVNPTFLAALRPGTLLINTSRGPVVDTAAVLDALDRGQLAGAAFDVLEFEESSLEAIRGGSTTLERLRNHPDVVLSPHVAGWTVESYIRLSEVLADKMLAAFRP